MSMWLRSTVLAGLAVLALAVVSGALAALTPTLAVNSDVNGQVTIVYAQAPTDETLAKLTIFVPADYVPATVYIAGAKLGQLTLPAVAADQAGATVQFTGAITVGSAADAVVIGGTSTTLGAASAQCTGVAAHTGYFLASLSGGGQTWQLPIYGDLLSLGDKYTDTTGFLLTACLPAADVPAGTAGRAPVGAKAIGATMTFPNLFAAAPGSYVWHVQATPFAAASATVNAVGAVEAESVDATSQELSLTAIRAKAKGKAKPSVAVSGTLKAGAKPLAGAKVQVRAGKTVVATATTNAKGQYRATARTTATRLTASTTVPARSLGACQHPILAPLRCAGSTLGGFTVASAATAVKK